MKWFSIALLLAFACFCWGDLVVPCHCDEDESANATDACACICCNVDSAVPASSLTSPAHDPLAAPFAHTSLLPPEDVPASIEHPPQIG